MANNSVRSLQREISKSKLNYRDLLAQIRFTMATKQLKNTDTPVQEIAFKLGYNDPSHFTRAFRRSAGMSPMEYRKSQAHEW